MTKFSMQKAAMRWLFPVLLALGSGGSVHARLIDFPDENILWIEDGEEMQVSPSGEGQTWQTKLQVTSSPQGGFVIHPGEEENGASRYVKADPDYPYLVWQISDLVAPTESYRQFIMACDGVGLLQMVTHIQEGIFVVPLRTEKPDPRLQIYLYNTEFRFNYIKMVREPEYNILISSSALQEKGRVDFGDEVTFRVNLPSSAEDVSLEFFASYGMQQIFLNGERELQLKPDGQNKKIWTGQIKIDSCTEGDAEGRTYSPGGFVVKATVVGGSLPVPLWTANAHEFGLGKSAD